MRFVKGRNIIGVSRIDQLTVKIEGPRMVRAGDYVLLASAFQQFVTAMRTDIIKPTDCDVAALGDKAVLIVDFGCEIRSFFADLADMSRVVPSAIENRFSFRFIDFGAVVIARRHGEALLRIGPEWRVARLKVQVWLVHRRSPRVRA